MSVQRAGRYGEKLYLCRHNGQGDMWEKLYLCRCNGQGVAVLFGNGKIHNERKITMKERRMLLVVDPQMDFITGSLPVNGAAEAMDALADYVDNEGNRYVARVVTADWHPYNHCSFAAQGGPWPVHCVRHSVGAVLWQRLLEALCTQEGGYTLLYKGTLPDREEYSILQNATAADELKGIIKEEGITDIDVCGLAGNICVLNTARDLLSLVAPGRLHILTPFAPSLDDGSELQAFIKDNRLGTTAPLR